MWAFVSLKPSILRDSLATAEAMTYRVRGVGLVLHDGYAARKAVYKRRIILRVTSDTDVNTAGAFGQEGHEVKEWYVDEGSTLL